METTLKQQTNEQILADLETAFNKIEGARVGDYLKLPYGIYTRFTHKWDDVIQTGGGSNSFHLSSYGCSYSGGLDSGVKLNEIRQINESKPGMIWFFDKLISGAGRGVHYDINFRVFEPIEGADLSGCPQIKKHERNEFLKTIDTVTRINGNGQKYTLPLPEVFIREKHINEVGLLSIETESGLKFTRNYYGYVAQPVKHEQLTTLLTGTNFKCTYYNNSVHSNTLVLEFNY